MKNTFLSLTLFGIGLFTFILSCSTSRKMPTKFISADLPMGIVVYKEHSNGYYRIAIESRVGIRETTFVTPKFYKNCILGDTIINK